jgi:Inositol polyphosphate kinase
LRLRLRICSCALVARAGPTFSMCPVVGEDASIDASACAQYPHQVGGHGQIVQADDSTVLKPLVRKEASFYEYVYSADAPQAVAWLRAFTPRYFGKRLLLREPRAQESPTSDGNACRTVARAAAFVRPDAGCTGAALSNSAGPAADIELVASVAMEASLETHAVVPETAVTTTSQPVPAGSTGVVERSASAAANDSSPGYEHLRWASLGAANSVGLSGSAEEEQLSHSLPARSDAQGSSSAATTMLVSPWAVHMADLRPAGTAGSSVVVVLEDINKGFRFPCVADVKCGKRHFDDDATPAKQARHIEKANSTTTAATGIRYIGLQSLKGAVYEFRDKYHGRRLQEGDLVPEARWFFHNGTAVRADAITLILAKLRQLAAHMEVQTQFLFYSSSLLIVYEGDESRPSKVDVRMIDFAHTQRSCGELDVGYVSGLRYLIRVFEAVLDRESAAAMAAVDAPANAARRVLDDPPPSPAESLPATSSAAAVTAATSAT